MHDKQSDEIDDLSEESCRDDDSCADFDVANCGSDLYSAEQKMLSWMRQKEDKLRLVKSFQI